MIGIYKITNVVNGKIYIGRSIVGRKYGVSDNAIRKWCKVYNIPKDKKGLKTWLSAHSLTG